MQSSESSDLSDGPITVQEFMEVKSALTASEAKIQQLLKVNCHLSEELRMMQSKVSERQGSLGLTSGDLCHLVHYPQMQYIFTFCYLRDFFFFLSIEKTRLFASVPLTRWSPGRPCNNKALILEQGWK